MQGATRDERASALIAVADVANNEPFAPLVPNADTIAAMEEAEAGNLPQFADVQSLLADLHLCFPEGDAGANRSGYGTFPTPRIECVP